MQFTINKSGHSFWNTIWMYCFQSIKSKTYCFQSNQKSSITLINKLWTTWLIILDNYYNWMLFTHQIFINLINLASTTKKKVVAEPKSLVFIEQLLSKYKCLRNRMSDLNEIFIFRILMRTRAILITPLKRKANFRSKPIEVPIFSKAVVGSHSLCRHVVLKCSPTSTYVNK